MTRLNKIIVSFILFVLPAAASAQQETYTVIGAPGLVTCSQWLAVSDDDSLRVLDDEDVVEEQVKAWVGGFLSAYNRYALDGGNVAEGRTAEELLDWADRFCGANPEATMSMLSETMIIELEAARE